MKLLKRIINPSRWRPNYWSCSKFSNWITTTFVDSQYEKPEYATSEEWNSWRELYQVNNPIVYWITEEALDRVQDFLMYPYDVYRELRRFYRNGFRDKIHVVSTGVDFGEWADTDTRMLNANFNLLVQYVEKEATIETLEWAATLVFDDDFGAKEGDEKWGKPTPQAEAAKKTLELYVWWTAERPSRPDLWKEHCEKFPNKRLAYGSDAEKLDAKLIFEQEEAWEEEDTQMLVDLIKIRRHLWT